MTSQARPTRRTPRAEWRGILTRRRGDPLPPRRAASRLSAYVYGNIMVLAALVTASAHAVENGEAVWLVLGTGLTTYIAHVFADLVAGSSIPEAHGHDTQADESQSDHLDAPDAPEPDAAEPDALEPRDPEPNAHTPKPERPGDAARRHVRHELRDATPIISSAILPAIALALGWADVLPTAWAHGIAGAVVVLRIASVPIVVERVRGNEVSVKVIVAGIGTAALAAVVVLLKVLLAH
ncbi:hypothetical protein [Gordonia sp. 852002-51296_SCH5728562-b]|uniref:hypothetical protein n=1 Tax=Gordonia sp. 852002-51296_SCH5728562-b TaxID=1834101 RepID=UPI0007EAC054|nr:hypothetical protein [Gordonia sp. 852002-51296_SCH5728562-b]OBA39604.1 hypothetical protein A5766_02845 [Gordonia sp. 852002-51296_SCH5728562-b]